jgi:hypothetical protein
MYEMIVEYFIKIALSNAIKRFKANIPRTKKQALRALYHWRKDSDSYKHYTLYFLLNFPPPLQFAHFHFVDFFLKQGSFPVKDTHLQWYQLLQ